MKRRHRSRTPELLARVFEALVVTATALLIVLAGGILLLHLFGVQTYIVMSGSMEPKIHTGAVALIDTTDRYAEVGDIVAYRLEQEDDEILVTHRIVERNGGGFVTKGDANESPDDRTVSQDQIVGTYIGSVPKAGYAVDTLGKRGLAGIVLWITSLNILSSLLRDITGRRRYRRNRQNKSNYSRRNSL